MKRILFLFSAALLMLACSQEKKITVDLSNNSSLDKAGELVELDWQALTAKLPLEQGQFIVVNEFGDQVPYQVLYKGEVTPQAIIFPVTLAANTQAKYTIKGDKPMEFPTLTFGRKIPERKDDFAWENDRIAFRVYGPALAPENPSNGVDIWLKKTDNLIVNKFYKEELQDGLSYHVDRGEGLDCYKVGHTLGAGAIAPFFDNKIWVENHYSSAKVLDSGILRTSFELAYDTVRVNDQIYSKNVVITLDAGSQFCKANVSYQGNFETIDLAAGIFLHSELGDIKTDKDAGTIAYAENAVSDAGLPAGRNYVGVIFTTPVKEIFQDSEHIAGVSSYTKEQSFVYYFGAGWSQWGFETDADWFNYVNNTAKELELPIGVTF